jgi:hypothetical protein
VSTQNHLEAIKEKQHAPAVIPPQWNQKHHLTAKNQYRVQPVNIYRPTVKHALHVQVAITVPQGHIQKKQKIRV